MKKKCNACNLEFETDSDKCPICGRHLIDILADSIVANPINKDSSIVDHTRD
jgi:rRNA maturation endonuclease Nob1